jgi:hypothetical protein
MPTLTTMCKLIAARSNGKWTVKKLLKWSEAAGKSAMESTLRISEITGTYMALKLGGEKFEHVPLNFKPGKGEPFDASDPEVVRSKVAEHGFDLINPFK